MALGLLGALLVRQLADGLLLVGRIVETEAYSGPTDGASHARSGRTARNGVMFGEPGHAYVYFTYGMHWMLNLVGRESQEAGAVLLRALTPLRGLPSMRSRRNHRPDAQLTNGPARLCQALAVDGSLNGEDVCNPRGQILVAAGEPVAPERVATGPRVGVAYAHEPWRSHPLRFWLRDEPTVSTARRSVGRQTSDRDT